MILPASKQRGSPPAEVKFMAPPVRGWNARDPLTMMKDGDALFLDNVVVRPDGMHVRQGRTSHVTGLTGNVQTLMTDGTKIYAATPTIIYDVTTSPAVASVTGLKNGFWSWAPLTNKRGAPLIACNGVDGVRYCFEGTWATSTITGVDTSELVAVCTHHRRAFFVKNGTRELWYLPLDSVQGEARLVDATQLCHKGGEFVACASLDTTGGRSPNASLLVAVTSMGEMVVWAGNDPNNASIWNLQGVYDVPLPVGRRCFAKMGQRVVYLSRDGLLPLLDTLALPGSGQQADAITSQIYNAYYDELDTSDEGTAYTADMTTVTADSVLLTADIDYDAAPLGERLWSVVESPARNFLLINLPRPGGAVQWVYETETKAWSSWSGIDAACWVDTGTVLYMAIGTGVFKYAGATDAGDNIASYMAQAYSYFGSNTKKRFVRARPVFAAPTRFRPRLSMLTNFAVPPTSYAAVYTGSAENRLDLWSGVRGEGRSGALLIGLTTSADTIYQGTDVAFERGRES